MKMKLTELDEAMGLRDRLAQIRRLSSWLDTWPNNGLKLDANGLMGSLELSHRLSEALLTDERMRVIGRLHDLGIEAD